jgi:hypothetical protein
MHRENESYINLLVYGLNILSLALLLSAAGCVQENPLLYDPTLRDSSVIVRFISFLPDGQPRTFIVDGTSTFPAVSFGQSTLGLVSPLDSVHYSVRNAARTEFTTNVSGARRKSFFRGTVQTFAAGVNPRRFDSLQLINLSTFRVNAITGKATVRFVNVMPDTSTQYELRIGCQNGETLGTPLPAAGTGLDIQIQPGTYAFTLRDFNKNQSIATFEKSGYIFNPDSTYTIFLSADKGAALPRIFVLNELNPSAEALVEWLPATQLKAQVRLVNAASVAVDALRYSPGGMPQQLVQALQPGNIQNSEVQVCTSGDVDSIRAEQTGAPINGSTGYGTLAPAKEYTVIIADSAGFRAGKTLIVPSQPVPVQSSTARIQVVNADYLSGPLSISIGGHTNITGNYESGQQLAFSLRAGIISVSVDIKAGVLPIAIFSSNLPQRLLRTYTSSVKPNTSYTLLITSESALLIEEGTAALDMMKKGVFTQIVHAGKEGQLFSIDLPGILNAAPLGSDGLISTVLPIDSPYIIRVNGNQAYSGLAKPDSSQYLIIEENGNATPFHYAMGTLLTDRAGLRVINLASDYPLTTSLDYDININFGTDMFVDQPARSASSYYYIDRDRRISFVMRSQDTSAAPYAQINNFSVSLGKNYSLIYRPEKPVNRVIIRQDF